MDDLIEFNEATNFTWLMSNVIDKTSDGPLANGNITHMLEWDGRMASICLIHWKTTCLDREVASSVATFYIWASCVKIKEGNDWG